MSKGATIEKAQKLASKGKIKEAIKVWQKLLSDAQDNGNVHNAIGDLQLKANLKNDAIGSYLEAAEAFKEAGFDLKSIALYKKTIKVDDSRLDIYEKLADIHAERGLVGNAIDDYLKAAKYYVKKDDVRASLDVYRKMADLDPENTGIRIKIAEMCQKEGFEKEAIEEFGKVLSLYEKKGMASETEEIREKILSLDADYFEKPQGPVFEPTAPGTPDGPEGEIFSAEGSDETPETFGEGMLSGEDSKSSGLIGSDIPEEFSGTKADPEPGAHEEGSQATETEYPDTDPSLSKDLSAVEEGAQDEEGISRKDDEAYIDPLPAPESDNVSETKISESALKGYLTEAEVYFKYGLNSKAIDQLLLVAKLCPDREEPYLKLKEIYIQEGITEKAIEACCILARIFYAKGDQGNVTETLSELLLLDQDGNYRQELSEEILALEDMDAASQVELGEDLSPSEEVESEAIGGEGVLELEGDPQNEVSQVEIEGALAKEENLDASDEGPLGEGAGDEVKEASELELDPVSPENGIDALEQMEGENLLSKTELSSPEHEISSNEELVLDEEAPLSEALDGSPEGDLDESSFEGISEGEMQGLSEPEAQEEVAQDPKTTEDLTSEFVDEAAGESGEKEDYVNLASILSDELGAQLDESTDIDDTLLEGAFNDLKKEVESTQNEQDMETHYDLGIAYKEMDMIPEAIKEFELSIQGDNRFLDGVIMLASCYRSRGAMATAIKTIEDALEDPRCKTDKRVPLLYEMAILVDLSGDKKKAGLLYDEVYLAEPDFRDIEKRRQLNEVEQAELTDSVEKAGSESKKKNKISYI